MSDGERLARYQRISRIDDEGRGEVWLAHEAVTPDQKVIVKLFDLKRANDRELEGRFRRALPFLLEQRSEMLPRCIDGGLEGEAAFLVMEHVEGPALDEVMRGDAVVPKAIDAGGDGPPVVRRGPAQRDDGSFAPLDAVRLVARLLRALELAEQRTEAAPPPPGAKRPPPIVHGGICPRRVLVRPGGNPVLLGLGTHPIQLVGVPDDVGQLAYLAPEVPRGMTLDARADVFSLGAILFELLCGRRAIVGGDPLSVVSSLVKDEPPPWGEARDAVPDVVIGTVERALLRDRERRFAGPSEMLEPLLSYLAAEEEEGRAEVDLDAVRGWIDEQLAAGHLFVIAPRPRGETRAVRPRSPRPLRLRPRKRGAARAAVRGSAAAAFPRAAVAKGTAGRTRAAALPRRRRVSRSDARDGRGPARPARGRRRAGLPRRVLERAVRLAAVRGRTGAAARKRGGVALGLAGRARSGAGRRA